MKLSHKKTACIIDDDLIYISLVKKIIERKNLCDNLLVFNDGKQSINYFETSLNTINENDIPEIIFLDLNMPIMDGWEFIERFKKIKNKFDKNIKLYVVSSSINPTDINRAKSLNEVNDYIKKPMNIDALEKIFKYNNAS
jgi:CheY-like chemotaxis protein